MKELLQTLQFNLIVLSLLNIVKLGQNQCMYYEASAWSWKLYGTVLYLNVARENAYGAH